MLKPIIFNYLDYEVNNITILKTKNAHKNREF